MAILILQHGKELIYSFWGVVPRRAIPAILPFLTEKRMRERYRLNLTSSVAIDPEVATEDAAERQRIASALSACRENVLKQKDTR